MKRTIAACLLPGIVFAFPSAVLAQQPDQGRQDIERVIETFRTAIIAKDKDAFLELFVREDVTWIGVMADTSIARLTAARKDPDAPRIKKYFGGNPRQFIEQIAASEGKREETFDNVRIDSDGDVAQVWFDYSYNANGYKKNWGKEAWHLVRTEDGWKIASVIWSQELNPAPPPAR